ncbi:hydroxyacid dehydrogenase [Ancylobacter sp. MQZ15Z-1]|uniref:Hydroxyacid dehydrogenase n=1 Tax=Ancylobacter mangrovi TaxID=2972472 RepID=A0A9X2T610_9HYPH|nr:hydroxyacid dehydrogenase [Ancylobacter mangrovi]MCS0494453.1 hydroxyacid dehydrogenase [Ancylobacter mangrovi]
MNGSTAPINRKRLVFFERFFDPVAEQILGDQEDIELIKLRYGDDENENWRELSRSCAYQIGARTELVEPWFADGALIARAPRLLAICSIGAGYDVVDVDACTEAGIAVCSQSGTNCEPVAEHAIGMMLNLSKKIGISNRALLRGGAADRMDLRGNDIVGKTVGIVGIGAIGSRTAQFCRAFDMTVLAYDPYLTREQIAARGAEKVEFGELLARADFVTAHCPRTEETLGMFDEAAFAQMKPSAYFLNTARGRIHDEGALLDALRRGVIAGAGIDVFDHEPPPPDHPLLQLDNVIATPHIAGMTAETFYNMSVKTAEQWIELLRGKVPPRLVNPEVWPRYSARFEEIVGFRPQPLG